MVGLDHRARGLRAAEGRGEPGDLVVEDVGEALQEDEREDVVLELGGVLLAADTTGGFPNIPSMDFTSRAALARAGRVSPSAFGVGIASRRLLRRAAAGGVPALEHRSARQGGRCRPVPVSRGTPR